MVDFEKAYFREKELRKRAEQLLEDKSRELYSSFYDLQQAHHDLKQQQNQLVSSERMASLGVMAAGIAHEINNPIGFVSSNLNTIKEAFNDIQDFIEVLEQQLDVNPNDAVVHKIRESLDKFDIAYLLEDFGELSKETLEGLDRVKQIIADLKSFAREDSGDMQELDVNDCLRGALNILNNQLKYHAVVDVSYGELPTIKGFYGKLSQVFINLIANANQAVEDQGSIKIETCCKDNSLYISVEDDGPGISSDHIDQLFTPFFTTKPVGEGTGLGLSISQGVVEEHGGSIEVSSTPGEGACFTVVLPAPQ
ncbi:sensor histidine kinase [Bacterioplanoides sp.]|uniref:sensor histidine kinase n=1 Tax=Bacterioplanoides sp. TaxID=2066072 RepID=UPI003B5B7193